MSISSQVAKNSYTANGTQTRWAYTFPVVNTSDIEVYLTSLAGVTSKVESNFTVDTDTLEVVYPSVASELDPIGAGLKVTLKRAVPRTQGTDYTAQGSVSPASVESALDAIVLMIQDLAEEVARAIKYPVEQTPTETTVTGYISTLAGYAASASAASGAAADSAAAALSSETNANNSKLAAAASADSAAASASYAGAAAVTEIDSRFREGPYADRPATMTGFGLYYDTDSGQLFQYTVAKGWEAK